MKNPWKILQGACAAAGLMAAMLTPGTAQAASVLDAPHNESQGVRCGSCHTYSLWWQYSPASSSPGFAGLADAVCNKCHGPGGSEVSKVSHSASSMGDAHNPDLGNWSTKCIDCHNPHMQPQLNWLAASATFGDGSLAGGLYLVEGTIDSITDNGNGTTDIHFTNAAAKAPWEDTLRWDKKSGTTGRGLLLSLGYTTADKTYEVIAASTTAAITHGPSGTGVGTLTVQSGNDPVPASYTGTNFGLIYGQLVKSSINTPNSGAKSVEFFDSQDGLVDSASGAATKAICQVCHTQTTYWRNDGTLAIHNDGAVCTTCHPIAAGFKPNYPDHNGFIAKLTSCGTCHTGAKVVEDIHRFNCATCHAAGGPPALKPYDPLTPFRTNPTVWPTGSTPPNSGDCGQCHGSDYFDNHQHKNDHSGQVDKAVPNCTSACHYHDKTDTIVDIHKNNCGHCHDLANGGVKISLAAQYGPGNCTNCHRDIAADPTMHPKASNHAGQVDRDPSCTNVTGCHPGNTVYQVHPQMCVTCHEPTYFGLKLNLQQYGITKAMAITPGTCVACHSQTATDGHDAPPAP